MCFSMNSLMSRRVSDCSSSKRNSARAFASSVLPTPLGPEEEERADGLARIAQPDAPAPHGARDGAHRLVLPDDALGQALLHLEELLALGLEHLADGDAGPVAEHDAPRLPRSTTFDAACSALLARPRPSRPRACVARPGAARARARRGARSPACRARRRARARARSSSARSAAKAATAPRRESSCARISLTVGSRSRDLLLDALARLDAHRVVVARERRELRLQRREAADGVVDVGRARRRSRRACAPPSRRADRSPRRGARGPAGSAWRGARPRRWRPRRSAPRGAPRTSTRCRAGSRWPGRPSAARW